MKRYLWVIETRMDWRSCWSIYDVFTSRADAREEVKDFDRKLYQVRIVRYVSER